MIKPYFQLSENGQKIFKEIIKHYKPERVDLFGLTVLAQSYDLFQVASGNLKTSDGPRRSSALMQMDKAVNWIVKLSPK